MSIGSCTIDYDRVRAARQKRALDYSSDVNNALIQKTVNVRLIDTFYKEGKARRFIFSSDEPEDVGGRDRAPQPTEYLLASLGFCQASIYVQYAAAMRIPIQSLDVTVRGFRDNRGLEGLADVRVGYYRIELETRIRSDATSEKVATLAAMVESKCPVYDNLSRPTPISNRVLLDGAEVHAWAS